MTHIGLIGLGTMGANLARNAAHNGATVAVFNRTKEKTDAFMRAHGAEGKFIPCSTIEELINALPVPRSIILMVNAGKPVDDVIGSLLAPNTYHLSPQDAIIDAGNSHFSDTERRISDLRSKGIHFLGMGVSGGEEGALLGPSMMPGGSREAFDRLEPLLRKMAAKDGSGGKCVTYVGSGGAGHFVKMVHNGIEYGDMQLIAEAYHLMKSVLKMSNAEIADTFGTWNRSRELKSYLMEISVKIFRQKDAAGEGEMIDMIKGAARQKGTGKWTTQSALDLGVAIPTITAAVDARFMSAADTMRSIVAASPMGTFAIEPKKVSLRAIKDALLLSRIASYAQGFQLIAEASRVHDWSVDKAELCRIWKGGCIIRSSLLTMFEEGFRSGLKTPYPPLVELFVARHLKWRKVIAAATLSGIPLPAMSASLAWFDALRSTWLPQNLTQAQRDFFGAHGFERIDREGTFHEDWK
ncbi:MAG: NADP-dependent phosphogluconate dehydrogenase [Candidatus Peribacteraceae bacterium]|nr:NADP-dependent phosphogluconate dehydrogenase [Candidatus Peribacteraceae bacterium]